MTYRDLKLKIKEEQKTLAQKIKEQKGKRKQLPDGYVEGLYFNKFIYRHTHIAYCEYFNRTPYEKIENFSYERPDRNRIDRFKNEWEGQLDEALRDCA